MICIHLLECYFVKIETKDRDKSMNESQKGGDKLEFTQQNYTLYHSVCIMF